MLIFLLLLSALLLIVAYRFYGRFLERRCEVDSLRATPACEFEDETIMKTRPSVLFGHHFSSIAGAGPIVGPIIAASAFGWLPTWIWIIAGSIFVGGVHDFEVPSCPFAIRDGRLPNISSVSRRAHRKFISPICTCCANLRYYCVFRLNRNGLRQSANSRDLFGVVYFSCFGIWVVC